MTEVENPYYEFYQKYNDRHLYNTGNRWQIPVPELGGGTYSDCSIRRHAVRKWAWGVPSPGILKILASYSPIVEIGASTGYWASLLSNLGADIIAYDNFSWHKPDEERQASGFWDKELGDNSNFRRERLFFPILEGSAEIAGQHPDRALLLIWPTMPSHDEEKSYVSMAHRAVSAYKGKTVLYIGEWKGCTACEGFFKHMERNYNVAREERMPQWDGLHDYLTVWERKN